MEHHIAIIGAGPRGTYCFRRLALELARGGLKNPVHIHMIEKSGKFGGGGIHSVTQPHYLLLNTVASQITAFGDDDHEARESSHRKTLHGYLRERGFDIGPNDYPPRALHGEYLAAAFDWTEAGLPAGVSLHRRPVEALDVVPFDNGVQKVVLSDGEAIPANEVLLLTGHAKNRVVPGSMEDACRQFATAQNEKGHDVSYTHLAYPISEKLKHIRAGQWVYVIGMGLTAIDVVRGFTHGRGGVFKDGKYMPGGQEPRIVLGSRLGLPYCARGRNQKTGQYKGSFLTPEHAVKLKERDTKTDFEKDLFPAILREMDYVYYSTLLGESFGRRLLETETASGRRSLIEKNVPEDKRFDWMDLENPLHGIVEQRGPGNPIFDSFEDYTRFVLEYMGNDLAEARKGNMTSPLKNAVDSVLRDLRDVIRSLVDHGGLTAKSHRHFKKVFDRTNNRVAVGPPIQSTSELLTLAEQGFVSFSGPSPEIGFNEKEGVFEIESRDAPGSRRHVRHVVNGRIHNVDNKNDTSPLMRNLFKRGMVRTYANVDETGVCETGGLDVTRDFHLVAADGSVHRHLCALGIPLEGKLWFNAADARPDVNSNAIAQLSQWAGGAVSRLGRREKNG